MGDVWGELGMGRENRSAHGHVKSARASAQMGPSAPERSVGTTEAGGLKGGFGSGA